MSRVNHTTIRSLDELRDAKERYYVVALHPDYNQENYSQLEQYGLEEIKDFIFRKHRPTVLTNYDCSKGRYSDVYGNTIDGWNAVIGKVVFNGCNNHIVLGKDVGRTENLTFELSSNAIITIQEKTRFNAETKFQVIGYNGRSNIAIMNDCRFTDALFRLYNHEQTTSVRIGEKCSFESNIEFHANAGKKIVIGRDCMFSHDIDLWAGDGHTIFEIETGKNINSDYHSLPEYKNKLVLGEHVWVSKGAFIMHGTTIGNGCVVGAKSVVKGVYPNNCTIAGNPAAIIRKNIAWSREMVATDIRKSVEEKYIQLTENKTADASFEKVNVSEGQGQRKVLILGGTGRMSSELTSLCIANGDDVTIAVRGKHKMDNALTMVKKVFFDRLNEKETRTKLKGHIYDVVFDCSALVPQCVDWVLSTIKVNRYIYISSFETYAHYHSGYNVCEDDLPIIGKSYESIIRFGKEKSWYQRGKYNAELLIANKFSYINYAIVRIPFVMASEDDYDDELASRILKYVSAVINDRTINIRNIDRRYSFVRNKDEANFLYFLSKNNFKGVVNFASQGCITMREVVQYVEKKTGKQASYSEIAENFPFTGHPECTMNLDKCLSLSYTPENIKDWLPQKIDRYIEHCKEQKIKNWLIVGGDTELGQMFVVKLLQLGFTVIATGHDMTCLEELPNEVVKMKLDVTNIESCKEIVDAVVEKVGKIDVLVNNVGLSHISTFDETPLDVGNMIIKTNYWGISNMMKVIIPHMRQNRNGTIINISSNNGPLTENCNAYYVASKYAVNNLTKNLKFECQRFMRFMSVELDMLASESDIKQTGIHTQEDEHKHLISPFSIKNKEISKAVDAIIDVAKQNDIPRTLILGQGAYQQFPKALEYFEKETEKYKEISISTDEAKKDKINLDDIILPRNKDMKIQNWLITGGSGGFGKVLALQLLKLGYTVAVTSRDISKLDGFPNEIIKIESNLDSMETCEQAVKTAIEKMGSLDVLVNNATSNCWCSFEECPDDLMKKIFYVNFTIPQYMMKAVIPYMRKNKNGTVINISSIAGIQPRARVTTYSAAKAALEGITRVLKSECQKFARFMAVELVCMRTQIMIHNPVYDSKIADYQNLGRYSQEINNIPNRKDIAAQQIINVANQEDLPQSLLIGTESYLIAKNEIQKARKEYREYMDVTLSICDKMNK